MIKKIKLGKYTNLFVNKDKKFKEIGFKINFKMPYSYEDITAFNLLTIILRNSCKAYPTISSVNQKMEELYGLQISFNFSYLNDLEILSISGLTINPSYCEDKELLDKIFNHLHEIIYNPNVKNKKFDSKIFNIAKENVKTAISSFDDDKNQFIYNRLIEKLGKNKEAISSHSCGDLQLLKKFNNGNLYKYYKKLLDAPFDVYISGDVTYKCAFDLVKKYLICTNKKKYDFQVFKNMDSKFIKEEYFYQKVKQTKLAVVYSLPILFNNKKVYTARLFNYILGGGSLTSKLSKSIREKEGLCYSIYSVYNSNYGYLVIFTGISKNNVNHVLSKIQDEITLMAKGKISDTEIDNAKQSFINDIETIDDDIFANLRLYDKYALINENIDKSKLIKYYKKISKSELQDIAKNLKIKTYVVLTSEDSNEDKKI